MAAPNYKGEKRRKDLAKQAKKKEKLAKKLDRGTSSDSADEPSTDTEAAAAE